MTVAIAVDLGGTKVEACLIDEDGHVVDASRFRAPTGPDSDHDALRVAVHTVVDQALTALPAGVIPVGVGIGSAGPIDTVHDTVSPLNLPHAERFSLADAVRAILPKTWGDVPVRFALDGLCIAIAEHWQGAGRRTRSMLGIVVSTGIGGGIIAAGEPYPGVTGNAGHLGQIEVAGFTPPGVHGREATVERIASGPNIVRWARDQGWGGTRGEELAVGYAAGEEIPVAAVRRSAAAVGSALASATALLDLDMVVIGGGFSHVSPDYVDLVRDARDRTAAYPFLGRAEIVRAELGNESPLVGAAALVLRDRA
ncbi:ROK family protein [Microbacterium sp. RD1]|uniref:ROK family protein n=1 Tax=Microbacterium sp. RD1 TaxID=3457313 RepID=UPI003FA54E3D